MDRTVLRGESAPRTPFKVEVLRTGKIMTLTGTGVLSPSPRDESIIVARVAAAAIWKEVRRWRRSRR